MDNHIFKECDEINTLLLNGAREEARKRMLDLVDYHEKCGVSYSAMFNHLLRVVGLYEYIDPATAAWGDRFAKEVMLGIHEHQ